MVGVLGVLVDVDLDAVNAAGEDGGLGVVVIADGSRAVAPDVQGLVRGEGERDRDFHPSAPDRTAVDEQLDRATLASYVNSTRSWCSPAGTAASP